MRPLDDGAGRHTVRVADATDLDAFQALVRSAGVMPEPDVLDGIRRGDVGGTLLEAARTGDRRALDRSAAGARRFDDILPLFAQVSLALVATDDQGEVLGALQGLAPGNLAFELGRRGQPLTAVASLATRVGKISAVGVRPEAARAGVGTALLDRACEIYFGAGYQLVYGYFRRSDPPFLADFYRRAGFEIAGDGEKHPVELPRHGTVHVGANADQRMFSRRR